MPSQNGVQFVKRKIHAAVMRGPYESSLSKEAIANFTAESKTKVATKKSRLVRYDMIKDNIPEQMKVSPIAEILHKSKAFHSILDLDFFLRLIPQGWVPSVNENSEQTAPAGAIDQIGNFLMRLIHAFTEAPDDATIFQAKWDIKDGFWRLDCREGEEWIFCHVLPPKPGMPIILVVPTSPQRVCIESPPYFCTASETGRGVSEQYVKTTIGLLPTHKLQALKEVNPEFGALPDEDVSNDPFRYMIEVYMDDYIALEMDMI